MRERLQYCKRRRAFLQNELTAFRRDVSERLTEKEAKECLCEVTERREEEFQRCKTRQVCKFERLRSMGRSVREDDVYDFSDCVINLSSTVLSSVERQLLSKGLSS